MFSTFSFIGEWKHIIAEQLWCVLVVRGGAESRRLCLGGSDSTYGGIARIS